MSKRKKVILSADEREQLTQISKSRTESAARVKRAKILLLYSEDTTIAEIVRMMQTNRPLVERIIDKAQAYGNLQAIDDLPRSGHPASITDDAKSWIISLACQKPTDLVMPIKAGLMHC
jgi:hypothetical protein